MSPAIPFSNVFWNISKPVTVVVFVSAKPTSSTVSPTNTVPLSILPVETVPRPVIENTSSIAIKNGLSISRSGVGIYSSTACIKSKILSTHWLSPFWIVGFAVTASKANKAEPEMKGTSSPG